MTLQRGPCYQPAMLEGLPPNNAAHVMRLRCGQAQARAIADIIVETFDAAEAAASAFEETVNTRDWSGSPWIAEAYFASAPDEAGLRALIALVSDAALAQSAVFSMIGQRDWVTASLTGLEPVRAGRFVIHGAHDRSRARGNDIALEIQAALAFGTGHHGTTRGCLLALDGILKRRRPHRILDVGTGTGVLALAAARVLRAAVASGDIDPVCVAAARANARLNAAGPWLRPVAASGARHPHLQAGAPYGLIFANILARPLRLLAPSLAALAARPCDIILSGLLSGDVPGVLSAYRAQGFALAARRNIDGWATLHMRRGGAASLPGRRSRCRPALRGARAARQQTQPRHDRERSCLGNRRAVLIMQNRLMRRHDALGC